MDDSHRHPLYRCDSTGHEKARGRGRPSLQRWKLNHRFNVKRSTQDIFCIHKNDLDTEGRKFYGSFGHIRKKFLDQSYHECYQKERQWLHDSIIEDYLDQSANEPIPRIPWIIFTVGVQGSGKRYAVSKLVEKGILPLLAFVTVDQDEIRRALPEYTAYVEQDPETVENRTDDEAGYITETLTMAALQTRRNVIYDCSLQNVGWYKRYIANLRNHFPELKVALLSVTSSKDLVLARNHERSRETGRTLSQESLDKAFDNIPERVELMKEDVDYFCEIRNNGQVELLNESWENFTEVFRQTPFEVEKLMNKRALLQQGRRSSLSSLRGKSRRKRFSVLESSEKNHESEDMHFYGPFKHIRETLDYSYHSNYTFERQHFQDKIIEEFLKAAIVQDKNGEVCTTPTEPWAVFTAGAMGAGKSYTMKKLVQKGRFPLMAFVNVDPDEIRRCLPEFHLYVSLSPELAGELTRKESGYVAEILTLAGLEAGKNVLIDGSLRDYQWYQEYFARLRRDFPVLRLAIIHVSAPRHAVFQRASVSVLLGRLCYTLFFVRNLICLKDRAMKTGRIVPWEVLVESLEQVPKSVKILTPYVDYQVELHNAPDAEDIQLVSETETWETFQSKWVQ